MTRFSQRHGYSPLENAFQREAVDAALRTKLWNILKVTIWDGYEYPEKTKKIDVMVKRLWFNFLNKDLDSLPTFQSHRGGAYDVLKEFFLSCAWYQVYDFLEEISTDKSDLLTPETRKFMNDELEHHNSAYRFVGAEIAEITSKTEIEAIEEGLSNAETPVQVHLSAALRMLSDREAPDYRNSVKESISAVEAACRLATGNESATLGDALKKIPDIHPAFSRAFAQLYGYTSDASGIRHALTQDPNVVTYADAKFMLIVSAAFVSYLKTSVKNAYGSG